MLALVGCGEFADEVSAAEQNAPVLGLSVVDTWVTSGVELL
jgi:hypothetical protein